MQTQRQRFSILFTVILAALAFTAAISAAPASAPGRQAGSTPVAPTFVSYQGRIKFNNMPVNGVGYFKFAVVNGAGDAAFWSHDGTGLDTAPFTPTGQITLTVSEGLFAVNLGDVTVPGMTSPLTSSVFSSSSDRALRVWFSVNGSAWQQLSPDTALASVPYALNCSGGVTNTIMVTNSVYYTPSYHLQGWDTITGTPGTYTPTYHLQSWSTITGTPGTYTPTVHDMVSGHTYNGGAALDVFGLSAAGTISRLTPSADTHGAGSSLLKSDANGGLTLDRLNVGIGTTTTPAGKIEVVTTDMPQAVYAKNNRTTGNNYGCDGEAAGSGATLNVGGFFYAAGATTNYGVQIFGVASGANIYALFSDSPAQSYFAGNVGVGTIDPAGKLHVAGASYGGVLYWEGNVPAGGSVTILTGLVDWGIRITDGIGRNTTDSRTFYPFNYCDRSATQNISDGITNVAQIEVTSSGDLKINSQNNKAVSLVLWILYA